MTPAQRIRKAALGPTPRRYQFFVSHWLGYVDLSIRVQGFCMKERSGALDFHSQDATNTERRMFLLFVAEALENE